LFTIFYAIHIIVLCDLAVLYPLLLICYIDLFYLNWRERLENSYAKIVIDNLARLYGNLPGDLADALPGQREGKVFIFNAFGERCQVQPGGIFLSGEKQTGVPGILISLYLLNAKAEPCILEPFRGFKDLPSSMPYVGAFATHTERILVDHVESIQRKRATIVNALQGQDAPEGMGGDFSILARPLPKIVLCYIFYRADEEFPATVTCLFSKNANSFMPIDALADVGEYTSRKILELIK
jgi:hypothetical protein